MERVSAPQASAAWSGRLRGRSKDGPHRLFGAAVMLVEALRRSAESGCGLTIAKTAAVDVQLSYAALLDRARRFLTTLERAGLGPDDPVLIITDDIETFVVAFWACIIGGYPAVPLATPSNEEVALKIVRVVETLGRPWVVTDVDLANRLPAADAQAGAAVVEALQGRIIFGSDMGRSGANPPAADRLRAPGDLAFIQFSSGSTGTPKGVTVTHANLMANISATRDVLEAIAEPRLVSWMPLTHDFGIICFHIFPTVFGFDHCLIPTKQFVRNPLVWMKRCSDFRATVSGGPNYSYRHFLKSLDPAADYGWDLTGLKSVINGAEPIAADLLATFAARLARYGFAPTAVMPGYGLAEGTLIVTIRRVGQGLRSLAIDPRTTGPGSVPAPVGMNGAAVDLVMLGRPLGNVELRILDAAGRACPDDTVGTISVRGPAVTLGYYNDPRATQAAIDAEGWLDTGDIGFIHDGELVVTGRRKDLIIIDGANYYPQDIERVAAETPTLDLNMVAACAIRLPGAESEALAVFVMFRKAVDAFAPIAQQVSDRIVRKIGIPVAYCLAVPRIPKTTSGKVQRFALVQRFLDGEFEEQAAALDRLAAAAGQAMRDALAERNAAALVSCLVAEAARIAPGEAVDSSVPLLDCGFTSLRLVEFAARLSRLLGFELEVTALFNWPTLQALADGLMAGEALSLPTSRSDTAAAISPSVPADGAVPIAIIGLGMRLPGGVDSADRFWQLLDSGDDATVPPPEGRWTAAALPGMATDRAAYLDELTCFDAPFFRLSPAEAEALDPRQRLLLSVSWRAFEDAAIDPDRLKGTRTGVFVGISSDGYYRGDPSGEVGPYFYTGASPSVAAGRLSYYYGFNGPCLAIDTACSSSLVALHHAVASVRAGESDLALVCGVNLLLSPEVQLGLSRMQALAPDGRCKAFDDAADGYGRGEGCVAVIVRRLDHALENGDRILAVLRGSAVNHDGASNGLTAPNGVAQAAVLRAALADAGVPSSSIAYLEAHGTGTPLGDPIEVTAAAEVFGEERVPAQPLLIGSVKTVIGHLEAAAGLAGVAATVLALEHDRLPASRHFRTPNRRIPWDALPIAVVDRPRPMPRLQGIRRVGVSSFGMSGTNAHVVLEAPPAAPSIAPSPAGAVILPLSARSGSALAALAARWADAVERGGDALVDLAATAALGRTHFPFRVAVVMRDAVAGSAALRDIGTARSPIQAAPSVLLAFAGHGSHAAGVAQGLAARFPIFRERLEWADGIIGNRLRRPLSAFLGDPDGEAALAQTAVAQPAIVALALAFASTLTSFGIRAAGVIGHSLGEIAAAAVAGAVDPAAALLFAAERGRLMQQLPAGGMLAVDANAATLELDPEIAIAAENGPGSLTLSGPLAALDRLAARLRGSGVRLKRLNVSHAFHSAQMEPILPDLERAAAHAGFGEPAVPFHSTVFGRAVRPGELADPLYWARQAREPVRFRDALRSLQIETNTLAVEIGARPVLGVPAALAAPDLLWLSGSDANGAEGRLLEIIAALFDRGAAIDWPAVFDGSGGRRIRAPSYPFEGAVPFRTVWAAAPVAPAAPAAASNAGALASRARALDSVLSAVQGLAGLPADAVDVTANWFMLGLDSLLIVQLQQALNRRHDLSMTLEEIYEHGDTPERMAALIAGKLPAEAAVPEPQMPTAAPTGAGAGAAGPAGDLFARQIDAMNALFAQQIDALKSLSGAVTPPTVARIAAAPAVPAPKRAVANTASPPAAGSVEIKGLYRKLPARRGDWTAEQRAHLNRLAEAYNGRTGSSKRQTALHREVLANPRSVIGFKPEWKELTYPLHVARAEGAHVFDIDGHEYIDITMGFGATLFGHNPPFIREAIEAELAAGAPLGPQSPRGGPAARLIAELTGAERVAFFTTGSEAVMVAVRLARAVTGRNRIVLFTNSYHGTFDGVLAAGWARGDEITTLPVTDGTPSGMIDDVVMLRYGDADALETIRHHAGSLAAVLVEPVQSRDPTIQPAEFLQALRALTEAHDIALVFDEMITGFRIHPGGAQHYFGIAADICTYGKIVGGGMPIGVVAGRRRFLDAIDGGQWNYGDDSVPSARTAFVAGTFNGHPLTMAAAEAALLRIREAGPSLQEQLNRRTAALCESLDRLFEAAGAPIRMAHFGSLFRFEYTQDTEILNYHLLNHGVFVWEGRNCFLSTAHTDADIAGIVEAARAGLAAMRADGWLPAAPQDAGAAAGATTAEPVPERPGRRPISRGQQELWFMANARPLASLAYNEMVAFDLGGMVDVPALGRAVDRLIARHEALRATGFDGEGCAVAPPSRGALIVRDCADENAAVAAALAADLRRPFDLEAGAPCRFVLLRRGPQSAVLAFTVHHIVADGWSLGLLATELAAFYRAESHGHGAALPPATPFRRFAEWAADLAVEPDTATILPPPRLLLPALAAAGDSDRKGGRIHRRQPCLDSGVPVYDAVREIGRKAGISPTAVLLALYSVLLGRLADQTHFAVGLPIAGHAEADMPMLVGHATAVIPVHVALDPDESVVGLGRRLHRSLLDLQKSARRAFRHGAPAVPISALLNIDRGFTLDFPGLAAAWRPAPIQHVKADVFLNVLVFDGDALFDFDYDAALIDEAGAERWFAGFVHLTAAAATAPDCAIKTLPLGPLAAGGEDQAGDGARRLRGRFGAPPIGTLAPVERCDADGWRPSGLIGRTDRNGEIEIIGSSDRMVRAADGWIDLDAVEQKLADIPGITAAVAAWENDAVIAWVAGPAASMAPFSTKVEAVLPFYRRPRWYCFVAALPRCADGTIDRAALARLDLPRIPAHTQVAPRNALEARLAAIWCEVLRLPTVGVADNFFDLGGQSLRAVAMLGRIAQALGRAPTLRDFLAEPTIAGLGRCLADPSTLATTDDIPRLPIEEKVAAANAQARLWLLDQFEPGLIAYNIGFALTSERGIAEVALRSALQRLAARHETLRSTLVALDGVPYQHVLPEIEVGFQSVDVADAAEARQAAEALTALPYDLATAPLWRVRLLRLANGAAWIAISIHHVISDAWSAAVLAGDLLRILAEEQGGAPADLPALAIQYRDYAAWHGERLRQADALIYGWRAKLATLPPPLDLPSDRPRPAAKSYAGAWVEVSVPAEAAAALRALAAGTGGGIFGAVAAGFVVLLHRLTRRSDLVIGTIVAGRNHPALHSLIGFFANTVPLRITVEAEQTFSQLVDRLHGELVDAAELGELPFDRLVEALSLPRDTARNPLFDVVLVMDDRDEIRAALDQAGFGLIEIDLPTSQFDLALYVTDSAAGISLKAAYDTDLFERARIEAHMHELVAILAAAAAAPDRGLAALGTAARAVEPTFHQERLMFVDSFERGVLYADGPSYYNMPLVLAVEGELDRGRLQAALDRLVDRHELLRCAVIAGGERPGLGIATTGAAQIELVEAGNGDKLATAIADSLRPFDLSRAPLLRAVLVTRPGGSMHLCLTAHHLIADRPALNLLAAELAALYAGLALPPAESFERIVMRPERAATYESETAYWRKSLDGIQPLLLPTDRPRAGIHLYQMGRTGFSLSYDTVRRLEIIAAGIGAGPEDVLRAAWLALLQRLSGQTDIIIGEPMERAPIGIFGPCTNLLAERFAVDPAETLSQLAGAAAAGRQAALEHGAMPFDLVVLAVKPQNDMSRTALFDVLFHYDRTPELQSFAGASVRTVDTGLGWGKYDLVLSLRPDPDGVRGSLVYNLELFAAATASRIAQRFVRLVESLVAAPEQRLKDVDLLLPGEFESILAGLRDIAEYPRDLTIHGAFEQVAAARAHATAIFGDRTLSYGELNRAANRLAHRLRRLGVAPDQPVGIMLGRCSAVPVAMLGILKAGAGYLPLDPDYPADRVRFMIEDSGTRFVVTDAGHAALVDAVATSVDISSLDGEPDTDPTPVGSPEALAYIIYTSGSTGQPKGVMIEHRNVIQLLRHQGMPFSFGPTDTWTWLHSPCFDFSVWEIFGPLLSGGRLVVVPASVARDPEALLALVLTHQATVLSQTPAAFYALTDAMLAQDKVDSAIAVVVLGGEALQPARLRAWRSAYPQTRLVNMYGITETTVHVTHKDIGAAEIADGRSAIGVPLPSYRIVIVDPELRLCPPGLPGEICVAGHGVGRSYLNRPDLDVARFVSLPGLPGRFYRSGDLGRLTVSGELIYLGRIDEQVKIRGFRIELGEIESHLLSHPQVRDAVVLADGAGGLTAWLVADRALTRDALIAHLGDKLPQFMVPSRFARIDAVPKTANGKVDRRRLAALDSVPLEAPSLPEDHPRSDLERALAAIWRELLDGAAIGRSDNFFELGGHSLKATQAVSRIRQRLGRSLSLKDFFSAPTLAALALRLEGGHAFTDEAALPAAPSPADEGYALSPAQRRLWLVQTGDPDLVNYNMVGAFTLEGALDPAALAGAFAGLVARHEALRTRFSLRRGQPRQRIDRAPESFHLPVERAAAADEAQAIDAALGAELSHVFSLESGPLLRVRLIRLPGAAARWLLVLNMHHIIADGWSVNVMLRDLEALYRAALGRGGGSPADLCIAAGLAALPLQYKDFAAWQHRQAAENRMTTARRYWVERFEDGGQVCELPTDRSRPAMPSFRGRIVSRTLDPILSQRLRDLALEYDASLFMVFAALVQLQLHLLSGQSDITIGTPVAGRDRVELEPQVGFYLNLLPIRVSVDGGASFTALLRSVRSAALDAFAHAGYPFDQLVEEVADQRGDRRNPLFDVMLILQNNQPLRLDLPGVAALPLADRTVSAKYDLNYMVEDRPTLDLLLEYAEELFDHRTVERIADEFIAIATSVIRNPRITPVDLAAAVMPAAGGLTADGRATVISAEDW